VAYENTLGKPRGYWQVGCDWREVLMSIEQAIHEIIADVSNPDAVALLALLPASRIATGENHDQTFPYASVSLESNAPEYRANKGGTRRPVIRFQVWHDDHAEGVAIRTAIETLFENKSFETTTKDLISTRHENSLAIQEDDGSWQFLIDVQTITKPPQA
jgi:hypothetical protein